MNSEKAIEAVRAQVEAGKLTVDDTPILAAGDASEYVEELNAARHDAELNWRPDWLTIQMRADSTEESAPSPEAVDSTLKRVRHHLELSARAYFIEQAVEMGVPTGVAAAASRLVRLRQP